MNLPRPQDCFVYATTETRGHGIVVCFYVGSGLLRWHVDFVLLADDA